VGKFYIKIINLVKYNYEFTARYLPALIFTILFEVSILNFNKIVFNLGIFDLAKIPLFIIFSLIIAVIPKIISTNVSGFIQTLYWDIYGNSIIKYLNKTSNINYKNLLNKFNNNDELVAILLKETREDKKLLSKNIFYGFFRNFTFLVLVFLIINIIYFQYFIIENVIFIFFCFLMIYISSQRYIEQICKSYLEKHI